MLLSWSAGCLICLYSKSTACWICCISVSPALSTRYSNQVTTPRLSSLVHLRGDKTSYHMFNLDPPKPQYIITDVSIVKLFFFYFPEFFIILFSPYLSCHCFFSPVMFDGCFRGRRLLRGSTALHLKSLRTWRPDSRRLYWAQLGLVRRWFAAAEVSSVRGQKCVRVSGSVAVFVWGLYEFVFMETVICLLFQKGVPMAARRMWGGGRTSHTGDKIQTESTSMFFTWIISVPA